jgi:hypothetical protein
MLLRLHFQQRLGQPYIWIDSRSWSERPSNIQHQHQSKQIINSSKPPTQTKPPSPTSLTNTMGNFHATSPSAWLNIVRRKECRGHYIQYTCQHYSPLIRTQALGCRKCVRSKTGQCLPSVREVTSCRWCPECEAKMAKARKEKLRALQASIDDVMARRDRDQCTSWYEER